MTPDEKKRKKCRWCVNSIYNVKFELWGDEKPFLCSIGEQQRAHLWKEGVCPKHEREPGIDDDFDSGYLPVHLQPQNEPKSEILN